MFLSRVGDTILLLLPWDTVEDRFGDPPEVMDVGSFDSEDTPPPPLPGKVVEARAPVVSISDNPDDGGGGWGWEGRD